MAVSSTVHGGGKRRGSRHSPPRGSSTPLPLPQHPLQLLGSGHRGFAHSTRKEALARREWGRCADHASHAAESADSVEACASTKSKPKGQRPNANQHNHSQGGLPSLGFGKGIRSRPTLDDHCVCPFAALSQTCASTRHNNDQGEEFSGPLVMTRNKSTVGWSQLI